MVAKPQQRLGNALVTNFPEDFKDEIQRRLTISVAPDRQESQNIVEMPTGLKIDHAERGIKTRGPKR